MTAKVLGRGHQVRSVLLTITLIMPGFAFAQSTLPLGNIPQAPVGHRQPNARDVPSSDNSLPDNLKEGASNVPFGPLGVLTACLG